MCKTELRKEIERRESCNNRAPFPVYDTEVIQDLKILENMKNEENYDSEKVSYCKTCLSLGLKIITIPSTDNKEDTEITYCVPCGNTEIEVAQDIFEWEDMYAEKYGDKFLERNKKD
tara:strand:- start:1007 stop:1357 length:351 start_codon:yes stop_codon:yes gene_type:complete